jgi:uncharacterized membrane protein YciS (DUF1049 family)
MNRTIVAIVFAAGLVAGYVIAGTTQTSVQAQSAWECRSWETNSNTDNTGEIETFLGSATNVQLTSAGVDVATRYVVTACKN